MLRHELLALEMPHSTAFLDHVIADIHLQVTNMVKVKVTDCSTYI